MSDRTPITPSKVPQHCDPAGACTSWHWITTVLKPMGLTIVALGAKTNNFSPVFGLLHLLAGNIEETGRGQFDSTAASGGVDRFFFNCPVGRLNELLPWLRVELEALDILPLVQIAYADTEAQLWRTFVPPSQ